MLRRNCFISTIVVSCFCLGANSQDIQGVDSGGFVISPTIAQCLINNGYQFFISRISRTTGDTDITGIQNIVNAQNAGIPYVHAYIFIKGTVDPTNQVISAITSLSLSTTVQVLWLDVETAYWSSNQQQNQQYFVNAWNAAVPYVGQYFTYLGVYSSQNHWTNVFGVDWNPGLPESTPIWWSRYKTGCTDSCSCWLNFGPWSNGCPTNVIHQTCCTVGTSLCSSTFDLDTAAWVGASFGSQNLTKLSL